MRKIVVNLGKLIEDITINLGENGVGKSAFCFAHEVEVPKELKMQTSQCEEANQEKQHATK